MQSWVNPLVTKPRPGERVTVKVRDGEETFVLPDLAVYHRSKWHNSKTNELIPWQVWSWRVADCEDAPRIDPESYRKYVINAASVRSEAQSEGASSSPFRISEASRKKLEALARPAPVPTPEVKPTHAGRPLISAVPRRPTTMRVSIGAMIRGEYRDEPRTQEREFEYEYGDHDYPAPYRYGDSPPPYATEAQVIRTGFRFRTMR